MAALGERLTPVLVDLTDSDSANAVVRTAIAVHGRIDGLVNKAGAVTPQSGSLETGDADWGHDVRPELPRRPPHDSGAMWETPCGFGETIASLLGVSLEEAATRLVTELRLLLTGRTGQPDDVARVIAYLISPAVEPIDRRRVGRRRQRITTVVTKGDVVKPKYIDAHRLAAQRLHSAGSRWPRRSI